MIQLENKIYKYYSTHHPIEPGIYPEPPENQLRGILHYKNRIAVEDGAFHGYGELYYEKPLTIQQQNDYGLRASQYNPDFDIRVDMDIELQLVGEWEDSCHIPEKVRCTVYSLAQGMYLPRDGVTPMQLYIRYKNTQKPQKHPHCKNKNINTPKAR